MTTCAEFCSIFDLSSKEEIFGLKEVNHDFKESFRTDCLEDKSPEDVHLLREVSDKMVCSACRCAFVNREEQKEHYKLDWHRFNLRQKVSGLNPLTAEEFEKKTGAGDLSSISGSESDSEEEDFACKSGETRNNVVGTDDESSAMTGRLSSKVVFQNSAGAYLMVYQAALMGKTKEEVDAVFAMKSISQKTVWVILVTGGGHFAGAVFEGKEVLHHKTFHRYTVRAKRGTTQGLRDSQSRVTAKSAGATLRRYNEAALVKDIQDLLVTWAEHLDKASAIFVRAPSYNKTIFFGGRGAPLGKKDPRIRSIPFATRRATFREVQRIHQVLSTVHVYGKETDMSSVVSPSNKRVWKRTVKPAAQKIPDQEADLLQPPPEEGPESSDDGGEIQLEMVELTLGTLDLRENEIYPSRHRKRKRRKKEGKQLKEEKSNTEAENQEEEEHEATPVEENTQSSTKRKTKAQSKKQDDVESREYGLRDALFTACKVGDVGALSSLLQLPQEMPDSCEELESNPSLVLSPVSLLTKPVDSSGFTLLHVAAAAAQKAVVRLLLDAGADPACRDKKGQTPYTVTPDKETRNIFRKYMGENPDKYDYSRAQIPGPLTEEIESKKAEKKKAQKAQRKLREKEQKEKKKQELEEEEERRRFASLTDREKRALAAERRLAEQAAATGVGLSNVKRCWMCGESLLGKIPFHCLEYAFCSPRCVQAHRKANVPSGKT
uniref:Ankyrin repeat and zinc finger domain containing 1 n=1 Tax=Nothobranchius kuhntae TaxID=321403 RepID=A0A1A8JXX2_NOTKU